MEILKMVLMIIFAIDCIALTIIVLLVHIMHLSSRLWQALERSEAWRILTGDRIKDVLWKERLSRSPEFLLYFSLYWQQC